MPTRKTSEHTESTPAESKKRTVSFTIPSRVPLPSSWTPVLMALLLVASFLLGSLLTKVFWVSGSAYAPAQTAGTQDAGTAPAAAQGAPVDVSVGHFPVLGNKDAKVTIIEFADFRCPYCEQFFTKVEPQLIKDYVDTGKVKFAFRQFPFLGPASNVAADAAECANDQGKFWDYHDWLYKNQPDESDTSMYTTDNLTKTAVSLGMNGDDFKTCLDTKKEDSKATADYNDGQKAGVNGTPATFVNGVLISGAVPYAQFKAAIDAALAK